MRILVLLASVLLVARTGEGTLCLNQRCGRTLSIARVAAELCFQPSGACMFDVARNVTCWDNGARIEFSFDPAVGSRMRRFGAGGKPCDTQTFAYAGGGTLYARGKRTWLSRYTPDGFEITCGRRRQRRDVYPLARLSSPVCVPHGVGGDDGGEVAGEDDGGGCPQGSCPR